MFSLRNQPLTIIILGLVSLLMLLPALFAARVENWDFARVFMYHGILFAVVTIMFGIAFSNQSLSRKTSRRLGDVFLAFILMPLVMAMPIQALMPHVSMGDLYFEMLSCLTTTGASVLTDPTRIPETVHFWRALVAWFGGFLMLVIAVSIFYPARLGGFEVYGNGEKGWAGAFYVKRSDLKDRILRFSWDIFPLYFSATAFLTFILIVSGLRSFTALIHAMGVISTSGVTNVQAPLGNFGGFWVEFFVFLGLMAASSRYVFQQDADGRGLRNLKADKEVNLMLAFVFFLPLFMVLRHWVSALEISSEVSLFLMLEALWGSAFMVLSFLTTTGYESAYWESAQSWSGLGAGSTLLIGLCIMGGGIATTAGGVKLLRIYALYKHGQRELQRLSYPSSILGAGQRARSIRREGAYIAWVFVMLFLVFIALLMLLYTSNGIRFEDSILLAVSGLSTTGPLLNVMGEAGLRYADLSGFSKVIFSISMILGRLEVLAVIAVLSPNFWREG